MTDFLTSWLFVSFSSFPSISQFIYLSSLRVDLFLSLNKSVLTCETSLSKRAFAHCFKSFYVYFVVSNIPFSYIHYVFLYFFISPFYERFLFMSTFYLWVLFIYFYCNFIVTLFFDCKDFIVHGTFNINR